MKSLFPPEEIPPRVRFEKLFSHLPALGQKESTRGRPPFARDALMRALIYQRLRRPPSLTDLAFELENNPAVAAACGFSTFQHPPSLERFSRFLRATPHPDLENLRKRLVQTLLIVIDTESELPLYEITYPNDRDEKKVAVPMLREVSALALPVSAVTGDANYDCENILSYIALEMKALPVIPLNPRGKRDDSFRLQKDTVLCPADLPMHRKGRMTSKGRVYLQYTCPLHWDKACRGQYYLCPAGHPKFVIQKGCNYLLRLSPSIRDTIDYGSRHFKTVYDERRSVERGFSRLLAIAMQNPTVVGLTATRNHCTIAHITMLLVALAAHREGFPDKIRYVRSFLPRCLV